jgi:Tol biopolymer transport system component
MRRLLIAFAILATLAAQPPPARKIAAVRVFGNTGQTGLFIAASDGSEERPLLSSADTDYDPVWAPDGSSIVFTSERDGSAELYRVKPDGSGLERLTNDPAYDDQAAFSPDGKQLVFVTTRGGGHSVLWTMDLDTRRARALTSGTGGDFRPSWSPDGKWIAFSSGRGNAFPFSHGRWERLQLADIYVLHPDRSGLRKITESGDFCGSPKWMSDNRHVVAYCMTAEQTLANRRPSPDAGNDTRLVSIDTTTGVSTNLPAGPGVKINPSPLPGNDVGYVRKDKAEPGSGIYYTSGKRGPLGDVRTASWSPDGKYVVFHRRIPAALPPIRKTFSSNPNYELSLTATILPAFSPTGDRFVTNSRAGPNNLGASLVVTNTMTGRFEVIHEDKNRNMLAPQWSPGGDRIIFSAGEFSAFFDGFHKLFLKPADRVDGGAQIAIIKPDGTGFEELTTGGRNNAFPSFAPDGKRFVFRTFENDGYGLRIMDLETKAVTALTREYDNFPLWSPRGDLILFSRLVDGAYEIYTIQPNGSSIKRLTFTHGNDAHMTWSPDGEYIAFASSRMGFKDEITYTDAPQPYGELFVMRYDGTHIEQLTDNQWEEGTPAWQPTAPIAARALTARGENTTTGRE